jgi:TonB family protein
MLWLLLSLLIRSGLILGASAVLRRLFPSSGATRHHVLAFAFVLVLLWPAMSALLPAWPVPLFSEDRGALVTVTQHSLGLAAKPSSSAAINWLLVLWIIGVAVVSLRMALAYMRVQRMARRGRPIKNAEWEQLLDELCNFLHIACRPLLIESPQAAVPFTYGISRARIVLPRAWHAWPAPRRRIVLLHELQHVRRNDVLWQGLAACTAALWWFQPLCWVNLAALRRDSEDACDAGVLHAGIRPSDYAGELLAVAEVLTRRSTASPVAIAMADRARLEPRIRAILTHSFTASQTFPIRSVALLAVIALSASALTVSSADYDSQGGPHMKRTLITGLLFSAGLLATPHISVRVDDSKANTQAAKDGPKSPIRVGGEAEQAKLIHKVAPVYPAAAKAAGMQGQVRLDVTISKEGVPENIQVLSSPSDDLTQSATDAVRQWRYETTLLNGKPVEVIAEVNVNYTLTK